MNKHLICVGFAKSGTTLLNHLLGQTEQFITPFKVKETRYFLPYKFKNNLKDYLSFYKLENNEKTNNKVVFEATPPYLHTSWDKFKKTIDNINQLIENVKILVCLRHPINRSFSHYIHNINQHFSYRGFSYNDQSGVFQNIYKNSFYECISDEKDIATKYLEKIKYLISVFGQKNVFFFQIEKDINDFDDFYKRLCNFVKVQYDPIFKNKNIPKVLSRKSLAQYLYADNKDMIIESENSYFKLEKGDFLICNDYGSMIFSNMDKDLAYEVSNSQHFWTRYLSSEMAVRLTSIYFEKDLNGLSKLLQNKCDIGLYCNYNFKDIYLEIAQPNYNFLQEKLTRIC